MANVGKTIGLTAAGVLALTGIAAAQESQTQNQSQDSSPNFLREADGNLISNDAITLEKGRKYLLDTLFRFGNPNHRYAMDPLVGLENMIYAMNNVPNVRDKFSNERRPVIVEDYKQIIEKIRQYPRGPNYAKSLEILTKAVSDGVISPSELANVDDGFYMLVGRQTDPYSVPVIVYVDSKEIEEKAQNSQYKTEINDLNIRIANLESDLQKAQKAQTEHGKTNPKKLRREKNKTPRTLPISLTFGASYSGDNNSIGAIAGPRFGYYDDPVNLLIFFNYNKGLSSDSSSTIQPHSPAGLYGITTLGNSDFNSYGFGTELYFGRGDLKAAVGAGVEVQRWNENRSSSTYLGNALLSGPNTSTSQQAANEFTGFAGIAYKGLEADVGAKYSARDKKLSPYFAVKYTLGQTRRPQKK